MGNDNAVIGKGDVLVSGAQAAVLHFTVIEHTGATVDDHFVGGQILRKIAAGAKTEFGLCAGKILYHAGDFNSTNVVALAVVGTALAN